MLTVLSLCDRTGVWSAPYREAGYDVMQVDLAHGSDVRLFAALPFPVRGVLAAPPCQHLARSGAWMWEAKGEPALLDALALVDACLRIVVVHRPQWWVLENPIGRLKTYLGEPRLKFDPADYGDPWTKRTWLWGDFTPPPFTPVEPTQGDITTRMGSAKVLERSVTPAGFARAFFASNP